MPSSTTAEGVVFSVSYPKAKNRTQEQMALIKKEVNEGEDAIERNTKAWNTFSGKKAYSRKGDSFEEENQYLKQRIYKRLDFMDMELTGKSMDN